MLTGETTRRSALEPEAIFAALRAIGLARLQETDHLWLVLDGSDLRKPHAQCMEALQQVRPLAGGGLVPGYPTLTVLGLGGDGRRGILYHRLYSSQAEDFVSAPSETRQAIRTVGEAVADWTVPVTAIMDRGFDDQAIWEAVWAEGWHLVCRVMHSNRLVRGAPEAPPHPLATVPRRAIGTLQAEMLVQKRGQTRPKRQPVTVRLKTGPIIVPTTYLPEPEEQRERSCWLVEVELVNVATDPWLLLTDHPVTTAATAELIFRMYAQRWAIEDTFKTVKDTLGLEAVQVLGLDAIRRLEALGWVALGYLLDLGVTLEWPQIRLLRRLGGGEERANRPVGKAVLLRGLQRLFDLLATDAILADERRRHGGLPPAIAALLGRPPDDS
jgi:Transposase DDE domain